jgi:hypothetical protein
VQKEGTRVMTMIVLIAGFMPEAVKNASFKYIERSVCNQIILLEESRTTIKHTKECDQDGAYPYEVYCWQMMPFGSILESSWLGLEI